MSDNAVLVFIIDSDPAKRGADQVVQALGRVQGGAKKASGEVEKFNKQFANSDPVVKKLKQAFQGLSAAFAVKKLFEYSDTYKQLEGRLKLVTKSTDELRAMQQKLFKVSQETRTSYAATVQLYTRIAQSSRVLGKSQNELVKITETVNKALQVGGATSSEATAGVIQLSQALAVGTLRGDEFRSVLENMPRVTQALETALGKTRGELIAMAQEGKLSSKEVADALLSQSTLIAEEFAKLPKTVGQSLTQLNNALIQYIGQNKDIQTITNAVSEAIGFLTEHIDDLAVVAGVAATMFAGQYVVGMLAATTVNKAFLVSVAGIASKLVVFYAIFDAVQFLRGESSLLGTVIEKVFGKQIKPNIESVGEAFDMLKTVFLFVVNEIVKGINSLGGFFVALYEGVKGVFGKIGEVFNAFVQDLRNFVNDPLSFGGFTNLEQALNVGLVDSFHIAFDKVKKDTAEFNRNLDQALDDQLLTIGKKYQKAITSGQSDPDKPGSGGAGATLSDEMKKLIEKRKEFRNELAIEIAQLERLDVANRKNKEAYDEVAEAIERENALRALKLDLSSEEGRTLDAEMKRQQKLKKSIEAVTEAREAATKAAEEERERLAEAMRKPFENALESVQSEFSNFFENVFSGGINSFSDLAAGIKKIFVRLAAELVTLQFFGPQGLTGLLSGAMGAAGASGATPAGFGGIGNLTSLASGAYNLLTGGTSSMLSSVFDTVGQNLFGIGTLHTLPAGVQGPVGITGGLSNYSTLTNGSFGGTLGGMAGGFIGNFGANALFGGNRGIGADIGGTIGAIAGSFIPVPILGPAIGSFLGNAIGGLFGGGKPSNKQQWSQVDLATGAILATGGQTGKKFSQENLDAANQFSNIAAMLAKIFGGVNGNVRSFVGSRDGIVLQFDEGQQVNYGRDVGAFLKGMAKGIIERSSEVSDSVIQVLDKIDWSKAKDDIQGVVNDLSFAAAYDKLSFETKEVSQFQGMMDALQSQFKEAQATVRRLGLDEAKLNEARARQLALIRDEFNKSLQTQINAFTNPYKNATDAIASQYRQNVLDAVAVGGNPFMADQLRYLQLKSLYEDYQKQQIQNNITLKQTEVQEADERAKAAETALNMWKGFARNVRQFKTDLILDTQTTILGAEERREEALAELQRVLAAASNGDQDAIGKVEDVSRQFLDASKDFYSTTEGYNNDFLYLQTALTGLLDKSEVQLSSAQMQYNVAANQLSVAQQSLATLQAMLTKLNNLQSQTPAPPPPPPQPTFNFNQPMTQEENLKLLTTYFPFQASWGQGRNQTGDFLIQNPQYVAEYTQRRRQWVGQENYTFDPGLVAKQLVDAGNFNEQKYLQAYPDVAAAVAKGQIPSGAWHYWNQGWKERRRAFTYAEGGFFPGGDYRLVGERGPEMELTGPARYLNFEQTRRLAQGMDERPIVRGLYDIVMTLQECHMRQAEQENANRAELRAMRAELVDIRATNRRVSHVQPR